MTSLAFLWSPPEHVMKIIDYNIVSITNGFCTPTINPIQTSLQDAINADIKRIAEKIACQVPSGSS